MQISSPPARRTRVEARTLSHFLSLPARRWSLPAWHWSLPPALVAGAVRALRAGEKVAPWRLLWPVTVLLYLLLLLVFVVVLPEAYGVALTLERVANYAGLLAVGAAIVHDITARRARLAAAEEPPA
ncbi:MAG: hypothetical protein NVSMB65_10900 [Chloroflexota bacterium]